MTSHISGICLSARYDEEINSISKLIHSISPKTQLFRFQDVLNDITILDKCDFIFTIGGDGSVAWLIGNFFSKFGGKKLKKLKPIVPVVRPTSVGYLKQLDFNQKKFTIGFKKLLKGKFSVLNRIVLTTTLNDQQYLAVNEINFTCVPQLGKITVALKNGRKYHPITTTMADGVMVVTPIGSTGWALSYGGQIMLDEESLEVVFAGGIHSSENFIVPQTKIRVNLEIKNLSVNEDTVASTKIAMMKRGINLPPDLEKTLRLVYGPRVIIDGKLIGLDINTIDIDPSYSVPLVFLTRETTMDKARKLTRQPTRKYGRIK